MKEQFEIWKKDPKNQFIFEDIKNINLIKIIWFDGYNRGQLDSIKSFQKMIKSK